MSSTLKPWLVGITIIGGLAVGTVIQARVDVKSEREREVKLQSQLICLAEERRRIEKIIKENGMEIQYESTDYD